MVQQRVLQIGMDPSVVDFSPWPGQNADTLRERIATAEAALTDAGFDVTRCLVSTDVDAAEDVVRRCVKNRAFDVIEIGSGLRTSHEYTPIFERVVNTVVEVQPGVPLCFNDSPETTLEAVRRGLTP